MRNGNRALSRSITLYHALRRRRKKFWRCEGRRGTTAADGVDAGVLYTCSTQANP
ncbi:hypothetical protein EXIGLDRAFT_74362 [Exidia glandulosa HHB12029]|uniref:Uncharacterized protein n=1 Tax=Exidia glandulosa HHB12029 TaxID=1314781 RepID=A0A165HTT5_EXIGL|nr:hypothetical protein EXIGLDRAFT_74362 [Exidia glandulosa HHB12029]